LWHGVRNTSEPFDDTPDFLQDATNVYIPDPANGSGAYARPGFQQFEWSNGIQPPYGGGGGNPGQCIFAGSFFNIVVAGGQLYWENFLITGASSGFQLLTGTAAYNAAGCVLTTNGNQKIFCAELANGVIISDGINQPFMVQFANNAVSGYQLINWDDSNVVLARAAVDTQWKTVNPYSQSYAGANTVCATSDGQPYTQTAGTFPAGTIPNNVWGAYRITVNTSTGIATVTAAPANYTTGYASDALARAALPAITNAVTTWWLGDITVQAQGGKPWIANTDALAGGATGNPAQATAYYAGRAASWSANGAPVIYTGALFFAMNRVSTMNGITRAGTYQDVSSTIVWSEANDPLTGYQQGNYDNAWTLTQTSSQPIYGLAATNVALYYFRAMSIGAIQGSPGVDFRNTATHDAVAENVGCIAPSSICVFNNTVFFADASGRANRFAYGAHIEKLWLQNRAAYNVAASNGVTVQYFVEQSATAFLDPNVSVYVLFVWQLGVIGSSYPQQGYVYDALTGRYMGTWFVGNGDNPSYGCEVQVAGTFAQRPWIYGDSAATISGAIFGWSMATKTGYGYLHYLTIPTAAGAGPPAYDSWADQQGTFFSPAIVAGQYISVKTNRLGYSTVANYALGQVRVVLDSDATTIPAPALSTSITVTTPNGVYANWSPVTAPDSYDGINLATFLGSGQIAGRGMQVTAASTSTAPTSQWVCYRVEADVTPSRAYPGER
jgi:hypothetical protein